MRCVVAFFTAVVTLGAALPVGAQEFKAPADLFGQKKGAPKPPKIDWNWRPSSDQTPSKPTVVCGMTLVPADPRVDPQMRVESPERGVTFAMRAVAPTVCQAR
jgi:hypothetical protein